MDKIIKLFAMNCLLLILFSSLPDSIINKTVEEQNIESKENVADVKDEEIVVTPVEVAEIQPNLTLSTTSNLTEISNCSAEDFNKMLSNTSLCGLGSTLVQIEKEYNINGLYMMGLACEESGYGTSNIARTKNNITGYCVYDSNPSAGKTFKSFDECLLVTAKLLKNHYLTKGGTYFEGYTPVDIDKHYCTDKNHNKKIINIVNQLLKKL